MGGQRPAVGVHLAAALRYAEAGLPVLPLHTPLPRAGCSCGGCDRPGKHPRLPHGLTGASTDARLIEAWWRRWPGANIGLRTGEVADVCDIDSTAGLRELVRLAGARVLAGPLVRTGSGGWHVWFAPTGVGNRVRVLPDVDWRGVGGYVVAPPSRHASGARYRWLRGLAGGVPPCPPALRELLTRPVPAVPAVPVVVRFGDRYARAALAKESERVAEAVVGERNDRLNRAAFALGRLVAGGLLTEREVTDALAWAAREAGLGRAETHRTIRSGLAAGRRRPRALRPPRDGRPAA